MDFYTIGSNGCAQFNDEDYSAKARIEMNALINYMHLEYPIPDLFAEFAWYRRKKFPYEMEYYHEIVLEFDDVELNERCRSKPELSKQFHDWFFEVECADLESDALTEQIENAYYESLKQAKAAHLRIVKQAS